MSGQMKTAKENGTCRSMHKMCVFRAGLGEVWAKRGSPFSDLPQASLVFMHQSSVPSVINLGRSYSIFFASDIGLDDELCLRQFLVFPAGTKE
jgi:hypothetical protein